MNTFCLLGILCGCVKFRLRITSALERLALGSRRTVIGAGVSGELWTSTFCGKTNPGHPPFVKICGCPGLGNWWMFSILGPPLTRKDSPRTVGFAKSPIRAHHTRTPPRNTSFLNGPSVAGGGRSVLRAPAPHEILRQEHHRAIRGALASRTDPIPAGIGNRAPLRSAFGDSPNPCARAARNALHRGADPGSLFRICHRRGEAPALLNRATDRCPRPEAGKADVALARSENGCGRRGTPGSVKPWRPGRRPIPVGVGSDRIPRRTGSRKGYAALQSKICMKFS